MKLRDNSDEDLSEEEVDDVSDDVIIASDTQSRISEIPENQSLVISGGSINRVSVAKEKINKRIEKAWLAAKELVDSEQRYVDKLRLLDEVCIFFTKSDCCQLQLWNSVYTSY